jgi:hypothetical protein
MNQLWFVLFSSLVSVVPLVISAISFCADDLNTLIIISAISFSADDLNTQIIISAISLFLLTT